MNKLVSVKSKAVESVTYTPNLNSDYILLSMFGFRFVVNLPVTEQNLINHSHINCQVSKVKLSKD